MLYTPDGKTLEKYADLLVNYALNSGLGVREGEVVFCIGEDSTKPLLHELQKVILKAGAHPMINMVPSGFERSFLDIADIDQLKFFPKKYLKARVDLIDHMISLYSTEDPNHLKGVDPKNLFAYMDSKRSFRKWLFDKEYKGRFTWTLAGYATEGMAKEAGMSLSEYWDEIIKACYLDCENPRSEWVKMTKEQNRIMKGLNALPIEKLFIQGENIELTITLGEKRRWIGGSGRNIPSYEIFTSPDWRGTEGYIRFNQPLYRYGHILRGIKLVFKKGLVVEASAESEDKMIKELVKRKNADKIGEFSLTDSRFSRITKFMANTLFDENVGGRYGNTHLALGMSYKDTYDGDPKDVPEKQWYEMGFNDSDEHTDIMSTEDRTVTALFKDGGKRVIYEDGKFTL